ncbi:MAG: hypothetical protein MMC33_009266 [Icmadophila ericetorum]|nr:hypothetical protein [Icmadophila ericetorum]
MEEKIAQIWKDVKEIKKHCQTPHSENSTSPPSNHTYASVLAAAIKTTGPLATGVKPIGRQQREIKVKIPEKEEQQRVLAMQNKEILDSINKFYTIPRAMGVKIHPSGDITIQTAN